MFMKSYSVKKTEWRISWKLYTALLVMFIQLTVLSSAVFATEDTAPVKHHIFYEYNGGTSTVSANEWYESGAKPVKLIKPVRNGYTFSGWYLDAAFSRQSRIKKLDAKVNGDITVYAKWKPIKYTVVFNANGGYGKMNKFSCCIEDLLLPNAFERVGYDFAGWTTVKKGTEAEIADRIPVADIFSRINKRKVKLYAIWQRQENRPVPTPFPTPEPQPTPQDVIVPIATATQHAAATATATQSAPATATATQSAAATATSTATAAPTATATATSAPSDIESSRLLFVSPQGNDSAAGDAEHPLRTIQAAVNKAAAGTAIILRQGVYAEAVSFGKSGSAEQGYIIIKNYPNETPKVTLPSGKDGAIFTLDGEDYICIEGLEIGDISAKTVYGILLQGGEQHIYIRNNELHHIVTTAPGENDGGESNAILCFGEKADTAISDVHIENNVVHDDVNGWSENISVTGNCEYVFVIGNKVYDCTNIGIDFYGNAGYCRTPLLDQPRFCEARDNIVYDCHCSYAECAGLYVDGARDILLDNNEVYNCAYGMEIGSEETPKSVDTEVRNIVAANNYLHDNSEAGIIIGGYEKKKTGTVRDCLIQGNTLRNNGIGEGGWNGEICFAKSKSISVIGNYIYKENTKYPMIGSQMNADYIKDLYFSGNTYYSRKPADELEFEMPGKNITGLDSFNALDYVEGEMYGTYSN